MHLPGNAQGLYVPGVHAAPGQHLADGLHRRAPPVRRVLLCPAVLRLRHGIFHRGGGHDLPPLIEKDRFGTRSTQVNAQYVFHRMFPPVRRYGGQWGMHSPRRGIFPAESLKYMYILACVFGHTYRIAPFKKDVLHCLRHPLTGAGKRVQ